MLHTQSLNGAWRVRPCDGERGRLEHGTGDTVDEVRYLDAQVPGEIHLDLVRAGLIREPAEGMNHLAARWVEECYWSYRREFAASAAAQKAKRAWLVFDQLDLAATVMLNGAEIARHCNVFYPCRVEVTGKLRATGNVLAVHVEGGLMWAGNKSIEAYGAANRFDWNLHKRVWLRKPQCQFGWDWSTRLVNVGITGGVRLEWTHDAVRLDRVMPLAALDEDLKTGTVRARFAVENLTDEEQTVTLEAAIPELKAAVRATAVIKPGQQVAECVLPVRSPQLWWPAGQGEQKRYDFHAVLKQGKTTLAESAAKLGFRHVRVNQDAHPDGGRYCHFIINGRPIFGKGGNFVPADMIFSRVDRAHDAVLIDRALEANFNFLRIWGGGQYESDDFYDLCDEKGVLVWQEFIFACAKYPVTDLAFYQDVLREARHNVRRLAGHPSLVAWCGNNEMEWGAWDWGFDHSGAVMSDYGLFHLALPRLLREEDPTVYYQPSSPFSPDGAHPNADHVGDQHPWSIGFADTDFRKYRAMTCRFPNEGGILGPTALPTMQACLVDGMRHVQSLAWQQHDNSVDSWFPHSSPDAMIRDWLGREPREMSIADFTYWSGLLQGEGLREYCENFRRRMFSSGCAIFWMYNDCWPATRSWTIVDYYRRRTPAFWPVRRALQPVQVMVALEDDGRVTVTGVNDTPEAVRGTLRFGVFRLDGARWPVDRRAAVELPPNSATMLAEFPAAKWTAREASFAFAMLEDDAGKLLARGRLFTERFKDTAWPKAKVTVKLEDGHAVFRSPTFAWGVCLDLDGETPLADNFFDLWPGIAYRLPWAGRRPPKILKVANAGK